VSAMTTAAKAYLQDPGVDGVSLYGHLTEVLATMLDNKTADPLSALESISMKVKGTHFTAESTKPPEPPSVEPVTETSLWHSASNKLLTDTAPKEGDEPNADMHNPNLVEESAYFATAGVGLPAEETYRVYMSLHKLQQDKQLTTIRFFGKILGTAKDYFVAEATYPAAEDEGEPPPAGAVPIEEKGSGCNMFVYYATNDPSGEWTELPMVTPEQLVASTMIRKLFTGDLNAPVRAYPPFPGKEKEYLRAQIARITSATVLCPKGKFSIGEDEPNKVQPTEEYVPLPPSAFLTPSSWCHYHMGILGIGRTTHPPKEEEEEADEDAPKKEVPVLEPEVAPLTPISADLWSLTASSHMGAGCTVHMARSLRWPGAYCAMVMKEDKSSNLYIGYGHEMLSSPYTMPPPPPVQSEPDDVIEQVDTPLKEENDALLVIKRKELAEAAAAEAEAAEE